MKMTDEYRYLNPNSEKEIKEIIRILLKPDFDKMPEPYKAAAKTSLAYYLTTNKIDFGLQFDGCLMPFRHPDDPRKFFEWLWEVYFPDEDYFMADAGEYKIVDDIDEPLSYFKKK